MEDEKKTKKQLIEELKELRQCVAELKGFKEEIEQTRTNQEKFTKAFLQNSIPVGITTLKEGRFVDVSDAFLRLMGRKRDEVVGHTSTEIGFITEEQRSAFFNELNKRGRVENLEMKVGTKSGALRYGLFNAVMMSINNENYLLTVMTDITERKSMERVLAEEHQRLSSILDGSPVSSFVIDCDRRVTAWNMVNEYFTGISKEDVLGKPLNLNPLFKDRVPPTLANLVLEMSDEEILKRYGHKGIRKSNIHPHAFESIGSIWIKGEEHIMAIQATRLRNTAGNVIGAVQCAQDITNQKRFEETLRKSEEKYRNIFENSAEGIYQITPGGRFITANHAAARILGYDSPEELIGTITDIGSQVYAYPEDRDRAIELLRKDGFFKNFKVQNRQKNGNIVWIMANVHVVRDDHGNILCHEGTSSDITALKRAEEALKNSENRYRELSIVDGLTRLYNSRYFHDQLRIEIDRVNRYGQPLTLLLLDLDNFKRFNDAYGHVEGDQVLLRLGQVIKRCLRQTDSAYRYGGEEFTIILPMTTSKDASVTAERIRTEFQKEKFSPVFGQDVHVTVSIGLAQYRPQEDMKAFVHRVDQLMYQAKKNGKDRVYSDS